MARTTLNEQARTSGRKLGALLRTARTSHPQSQSDVGAKAGVHLDTLRKIERGVISSPGFFVVGSLAQVLGLSLDEIYLAATRRSGDSDD